MKIQYFMKIHKNFAPPKGAHPKAAYGDAEQAKPKGGVRGPAGP